jgi:tetratricopeptide (TPR) repeat protein
MKKIFWHKKVFLTLIFFVLFGCGQKTTARNDQINYQETYKELFEAEKYDEALAHLQLWESAEPDNPEMFIAYYNYYTDDIFTAIEYLDRGLDLYPDRLDMYFSKIYIFNENGYYELAGEELFSTLEISKRINNNWV